jgi:transcriptional regulator with XRE-family HTH domain
MRSMEPEEQQRHIGPWLALRLTTGLSQREVERRLGWTKRGHLSLIERGLYPTPEQAHDLRTFYTLLLVNADASLG